MTIALDSQGVIVLSGACEVDDAELLVQRLLANPRASVDWSACETVHTAVIQVLFVAGISPVGAPHSGFLVNNVAPLLRRGRDSRRVQFGGENGA